MSSETYTLVGAGGADEALDALVRRAQGGEEAAFTEILGRFEGKAITIARAMGASASDAEDVAQEAFLRLFRHIGRYQTGRRFSAYFYRIVVNAARDHLRRGRPAGAPPAAEAGQAAARPDEALALAERRDQVQRALELLSGREREVVILRDLQGLGTWEVARILGLNPITVRRHAMQARARLKELLAGG